MRGGEWSLLQRQLRKLPPQYRTPLLRSFSWLAFYHLMNGLGDSCEQEMPPLEQIPNK